MGGWLTSWTPDQKVANDQGQGHLSRRQSPQVTSGQRKEPTNSDPKDKSFKTYCLRLDFLAMLVDGSSLSCIAFKARLAITLRHLYKKKVSP